MTSERRFNRFENKSFGRRSQASETAVGLTRRLDSLESESAARIDRPHQRDEIGFSSR